MFKLAPVALAAVIGAGAVLTSGSVLARPVVVVAWPGIGYPAVVAPYWYGYPHRYGYWRHHYAYHYWR